MPHTNAYAIEVHGRSAGILVPDNNRFVFFAADAAFRKLERRIFGSIAQAERSAQALITKMYEKNR